MRGWLRVGGESACELYTLAQRKFWVGCEYGGVSMILLWLAGCCFETMAGVEWDEWIYHALYDFCFGRYSYRSTIFLELCLRWFERRCLFLFH